MIVNGLSKFWMFSKNDPPNKIEAGKIIFAKSSETRFLKVRKNLNVLPQKHFRLGR